MPWRETAKREAKGLAAYVAILAVFLVLVDQKVGEIKREINLAVRVSCLSGASQRTIAKYDDLVHTQIDANLESEALALRSHSAGRAALNAETAARLRADLIPVSRPDCSKPLLP